MTDPFSIVDFLNQPIDINDFSENSTSLPDIDFDQKDYDLIKCYMHRTYGQYGDLSRTPKPQDISWFDEEIDISLYAKPADYSFLSPNLYDFFDETYLDHVKKRLNPDLNKGYTIAKSRPLVTIGDALTILGDTGQKAFIAPPIASAYAAYLQFPFFHTTISTALDLVWDISLIEAVQLYCSFEDKKDPSFFYPLCELNRFSPLAVNSYLPANPNHFDNQFYSGNGLFSPLSLPGYDTPNYKLLTYNVYD